MENYVHLRRLRAFISILSIFVIGSFLQAQTPLSGIINSYLTVTNVTVSGCGACDISCSPVFTMSSVAGLSDSLGNPGNKVLIIQMQSGSSGSINSGSTFQFSDSYGAVTAYGGAGHYELAFIDSINGNDVMFTAPLVNNYDPTGHVQMIPITIYDSVVTAGPITAQAWNGTTGGVLVLEVQGKLILKHDIDVDGDGFHGGVFIDNNDCCHDNISGGLQFAYYWDETASGGGPPCSANRQWKFGNVKGGGIFDLITGESIGRGAFANAGGGGSGHNSGGGGGGNGQSGGMGGFEWAGCSMAQSDSVNGVGGYIMSNGNSLFMGGGGGSGHGNNNVGTGGTNGGGIIILIAGEVAVDSTGLRISADGLDQTAIAGNDAGGGGGAGGTIVLDVATFSGNGITVSVNGGDGGSNSVTGGLSDCHGPGGGGGAGRILSTGLFPIAGVTTELFGGAAGSHLNLAACGSYGAVAGDSGTASGSFGLQINACAILSIELTHLSASRVGEMNVVEWQVADFSTSGEFVIERSTNGFDYTPLSKIPSLPGQTAYQFREPNTNHEDIYYRIAVLDVDGYRSVFGPVVLHNNPGIDLDFKLYPNPSSRSEPVLVSWQQSEITAYQIKVVDLSGKTVFEKRGIAKAGNNLVSIEPGKLSTQLYLVQLSTKGVVQNRKLLRLNSH